ncbi:unnamed protein product [Paramecium primaurelia]|uniref:STI1 domain-containing protein n=1 Tax=Paramecium primaurelia TaxID=5886 RepID=A0A8S1LMN7_PARPR|nr:unnamed protein product [Paramecium primaurelia]
MDDDIPDLEDFSEQLQKKKEAAIDIGDYTKPVEDKPIQIQQPKKQESDFKGLKKGFLNDEKKDDDIIKPKEKKNPLEINEVQENMKQNNYSQFGQFLTQNKEEWLNQDLLQKIANNPKLQKLFTNPEYLSAVQQMQSNPTGVMQRYKNNPEFLELMSEYMKTMGEHFQQLKPQKQDKPQQQQQQQQQPKIIPVDQNPQKKQPQTQEEKIQYIIENDKEVKAVLQDPRVQAFIEYLQRTGKADFQEIAYKDPQLMQKLQILIQKGVLNVQRM